MKESKTIIKSSLVNFSYNPGSIEIDRKSVIRLLGYKDPSGALEHIRLKVAALCDQAERISRPAFQYIIKEVDLVDKSTSWVRIKDGQTFTGKEIALAMAAADKLAIFALTLGEDITQTIDDYMKSDLVQGFFMDAIASVMVETLAEKMHQEIADFAFMQGQFVGHRYCPGYCTWKLEEQKIINDILSFKELGITLTENSIMLPRKSMSGIIGISSDAAAISVTSCKECPESSGCKHVRGPYVSHYLQEKQKNG